MSILQSVLTVLLSLLGSGVVSAYATHKLATSEKQRELKRQRLEQLFICGRNFQQMLLRSSALAAGYHSTKVSHKEFNEVIQKDTKLDTDNNNNLTMLCNIYFPELIPYLQAIHAQRDAINNAGLGDVLIARPPDRAKGTEILRLMKPQGSAFDAFNEKIYEIGQSINK